MDVLLPVPHTYQSQDGLRNACGPAYGVSIVSALTAHRPTLRQAAMATGDGLNKFTSIKGMIRMLAAFGLRAEHTTAASLEWVTTMIRNGIAPCLLVDYPSLGSEIQYRYAHFVAAVGYDNRYILLNDPLRETGAWPCPRGNLVAALNTPSMWVGTDDQGRRITGHNMINQALYIPEPRMPVEPPLDRAQAAAAKARAEIERMKERVKRLNDAGIPTDYRKARGILKEIDSE